MKVNACGKINWDLYVLGKRTDAFHEVDTVMVNVGLADELTFEPSDHLALTCSDPTLPCDDSNLIIQAAKKLAATANIEPRVQMHVKKRIPSGGGMGGGSADAAATLQALNQLWHLNRSSEQLAVIAAALGSDVAYFLWGGWCRCRGRGEVVEFLPQLATLSPIPIWIIIPPYSVPTPPVYKALGAGPWPQGRQHRSLTEIQERIRVEVDELVNHKECKGLLVNDLLPGSQKVEPRLVGLARHLDELFPGRWRMSGSGAVHFVIPRTGMILKEARLELSRRSQEPLVVIETATHTPRRSS
jgi:4-diphosphocytidyl-2C-methyl-D-erythritol kinase